MAKAKTIFVCSECGNESPKWLGNVQHVIVGIHFMNKK